MTNERLAQAVTVAREARRLHEVEVYGWSPTPSPDELVELRSELEAYDNAEARDEWPAMAELARRFLEGEANA